ncbi:M14 family metallopeptidase [Clostridium sp. C105KSO13]|uniref:M14 family metallopeptidase n=1 Tax=Clostridium sp. C105KSO13 TaxID=1776045 RepID=UPI0007405D8D|nr:M14 family metallopeptidase [Clostridium sp. C105KSO13]CUX29444.1 Zinc carboxypeptidase [Clostridium sp. C105KSO13]
MKQEKNKILHLREGLSWEEMQIAVEMARLLGFQSESAVFPVVSRNSGEEIPAELKDLNQYAVKGEPNKIPEDYVSALEAARPVADFDWRSKKGLETLFDTGLILKDENLDFLPDKMDVHFLLPKEADVSMLAAACNFAFRMGMETTAYAGLLLTDRECAGNVLVFEPGEECSIKFSEKEDGIRITVAGSGKELEAFSADFCEHFPMQGDFNTWTDYLQEIIDSMCMKNLDGQLAYTKAFSKPGAKAYVSPEIENRQEDIKAEFPEVTFINHKGMETVYEKEYDIEWEVDVLHEIFENSIYPKLKSGDEVEVYAALSEGKEERGQVVKRISRRIAEAGAAVKNISILCAYKQGYSWLEEEVVPVLLQKGGADRLEIGFKPFLPQGVTDWADEDGATPSYNNVGGDPEQWYDLAIRYLQELYPAEDMLAEALGIPRENIMFYPYEGVEDLTYELKVFDKDKNNIYESICKAASHERPYLDDYPQMGKVHPSTGYLKVLVNGEILLETRIETDVERIWEIYQKEVLPDCRAYIEEKTGGRITADGQPFFSRLRVEAEASEPDYQLPSREDLFTTLDGLHEDIYFAGADYFKNLGMEKAGVMLDAPGLILPVIRKKSGKPYMKVTLFKQKAHEPFISCGNDSKIFPNGSRQTIQAWLETIEETKEGRGAVIRIEGADEKVAAAYAALLEKGVLGIGKKLYGTDYLKLDTGSGCYTIFTDRAKETEKDLRISDIDLSEYELIGYEKYIEIIHQLKRVPGLNVYRTAVSYTGRELYAVEVLPKREGYVSRTRRITRYPSEIVNCRHHANEVSSTNAAFMLIKTLLTDVSYKNIPEKLNLVIVPMENVDGSAIHYELQKDNPAWKLHVARFNAVGREFYYEHFKPDTIHTEAMGLTRLFREFLPDIIVDNHGVPTHEWEQQFSGYTSPSYKGFWLPRSLLYGYFWTVTDEAYKSNYPVNKKLEDVIADSIAEDSEITHWNKEWARQFEKYAHGWMPKLFPANYYKDMINYWIPFAFDPAHRYPSIRFPWITTVAYTSEVADETAQGSYLHLCARAHLTHDLATLKMLAGSTCVYIDKWNISDSSIEAAHIRQRPIIV